MPNPITEGPLFALVSHGRRGRGRRDRLSPAQIQQIARTVARTPEVMVKVLPAGANSVAAVRQHLAYVGRQGNVELQTDDGQRLQDRDAAADLIEDWDLDLAECQSGLGGLNGQWAPKLVHKLVFSMPAGTPADKVLVATRAFCREQLALKHRYARALSARPRCASGARNLRTSCAASALRPMRRRASFAVNRARESPTAFIAPLGAGHPRICASGSKRRRLHYGRQIESVSPPNCGYARQGANLNGDGSPPARR
jgi:hypothetical protein